MFGRKKMESKLFVAIFVVVCFVSLTESSYFARRSILIQRRPARPRTCSLQTLTNAESRYRWAFPSNLSCDADVVVGLTSNNIVPEAAVGLQCSYTYSCPFDPPGPHRSTSLTCSEDGQWEGRMPDCREDDTMAQAIIEMYSYGSSGEREEVEIEESASSNETQVTNQSESEEESPESISTTSIENVRKSGNQTASGKIKRKLKKLCDTEQMCSKLRSAKGCRKIVTKGTTKRHRLLQEFQLKLCWFCFKEYCKKSVTLI